ncbi:MAG: hypothetical protein FWC82_03915, partial [Firmicutes bacterium]|nr:hypothetical protein [Bacillota bacterium]
HSYYFGSHDQEGNTFFVRLGLRGGEDRKAEVWFVYKSSCGKAFVNELEHMDASNATLSIECIEPLKEWKISFNGKVKQVVPDKETKLATQIGESIEAAFTATFTSNAGLYHFSRDVDNRAFAKAMAAEKWVKGFADELKNNNQVHIEQDGKAEAALRVGGESFGFSSLAVRDHSYGRRVWSYMNTYHWLPAIFENGYIYNPNLVRYPAINTRGLITGYKMKDGKWTNIIAVEFPLHAASGKCPIGGEYTITFEDKQKEVLSFTPEIIFPFHFEDKGGSFEVFAAVSSFSVNGVKGRGSAEFGYHGDKARYEKI